MPRIKKPTTFDPSTAGTKTLSLQDANQPTNADLLHEIQLLRSAVKRVTALLDTSRIVGIDELPKTTRRFFGFGRKG